MADYHVYVRDYHWSHHNLVVQSPVLNLDSSVSKPIVRPLEGSNKEEPRVVDNITDLRDDIDDKVYETEAHGVLVPADGRPAGKAPVWVTVHCEGCKENEVSVVNLSTFETTNTPITQVCWVPGRQGPDQNLYTVIGSPRKTVGVMRVLTVVQPIDNPGEAKFTLVEPSKLASYDEICDVRKKSLFEIQLRAIRAKTKPSSSALLDAYRLYSSPYRIGHRRTLDEIMDEDLEVPPISSSSSRGSFSDEDSFYEKPMYASLVATSSRPYDCDCRYAALGPTFVRPRPSHRHGRDDECTLGSDHKHCVYADHSPDDCVIPGSGEPHECCVNPSFDCSDTDALHEGPTDFELVSSQTTLVDSDRSEDDIISRSEEPHEQLMSPISCNFDFPGVDTDNSQDTENTFECMDFELTLIESPSLDLQQQILPDTPFSFARYDTPGDMDMTPFPLTDTGIPCGMYYGPTLNTHVDFEACLSPEPQDLLF